LRSKKRKKIFSSTNSSRDAGLHPRGTMGQVKSSFLAHVDLNPVRAGIVKYRWCSFGYHVQTGTRSGLLCGFRDERMGGGRTVSNHAQIQAICLKGRCGGHGQRQAYGTEVVKRRGRRISNGRDSSFFVTEPDTSVMPGYWAQRNL
jgi:hypothetical protein